MLEQLIIELAKLTEQVEDINGDKTYLVINKDDERLYVEAKFYVSNMKRKHHLILK